MRLGSFQKRVFQRFDSSVPIEILVEIRLSIEIDEPKNTPVRYSNYFKSGFEISFCTLLGK